MGYPKFYDDVESITLYDPLSDFLGSFDNGEIKFKYLNVVKNAGHSCPTVAGAYLMTLKALKSLYPNELPVRGEIKVEFKESETEGVAGVIANVITNITGATEKSGFKGIGGNFARHSLMNFNANITSSAKFTRTDNQKSVDVTYDPSNIGGNPKMQPLMQKIMQNRATDEERKEFGEIWQDRVKRILIDNFDNPELIKIG